MKNVQYECGDKNLLTGYLHGNLDPETARLVSVCLDSGCPVCTRVLDDIIFSNSSEVADQAEILQTPVELMDTACAMFDEFLADSPPEPEETAEVEEPGTPVSKTRLAALATVCWSTDRLLRLRRFKPMGRRLRFYVHFIGLAEKLIPNDSAFIESSLVRNTMMRAFSDLGRMFQVTTRYQSAAFFFHCALWIAGDLESEDQRIELLKRIGHIAFSLADYPRALHFFEHSLHLAEQEKNTDQTYACLNNIGLVFKRRGDYLKARNLFIKALNLASIEQKELSSRKQITIFLHLAHCHRELGEFERAGEAYEKAQTMATTIGNKSLIGKSLMSRSNLAYELEEFDKSIELNKSALLIFDELHDDYLKSAATYNIGNTLNRQGKNEEAIPWFKQSLALKRELNERAGVINNLLELGRTYREMGDIEKAGEYNIEAQALSSELSVLLPAQSCGADLATDAPRALDLNRGLETGGSVLEDIREPAAMEIHRLSIVIYMAAQKLALSMVKGKKKDRMVFSEDAL